MKKVVFLLIIILLLPFNIKAYSTSATSSILMDIDSKKIIHSNNIHNVRSVASISKIMTAIVAIENSDINKKVVVGEEIKSAFGSAIYIKVGEELTLKDLLYGLMLRSGNDAALTIAKTVSGSTKNFVDLMNETAKKIGMKNSNFNNPHGLDEPKGNFSTAYDMALLTSYAMHNNTYKEIVKTKNYKVKTNYNTYVWHNKNRLLDEKIITGGKTGFTDVARRTLVTTASKDNLNLVVVTLNDGNDFNDHLELYDEAYKEYKSYQILNKDKFKIYDDKYYKDYTFYLKNNYSYPLTELEKNTVSLKIELDKKESIANNSKVGKVIVKIGDKQVHEEDIYVKKDPKESFIKKIINWFKNLW